ncbi:sugar lactone lactonase YvrE [Marinilabilia salmonicolor]|uniref:SMP-30/gluconolactonase/LRE family protein n=1 Tax=Marinilabilia salmonicolor TaxID=989 RepID=UPI000D05B9F5|nr:SMP-30/gluconolactonase/LRE family protein [Marinilabilia salmonicolor]PRZ01051.1 sugar lactone lactonase YvrE [Marinilabilia salmonicolor]
MKPTSFLLIVCLFIGVLSAATGQENLYESYDVTGDSVFLSWAEGPAVGPDGVLYAVNYKENGTIGYVEPDGTHGLLVRLPQGSIGNGIRLSDHDRLLVADYTGHNILEVSVSRREVKVFAQNDGMNQPNDLAVTADGIIYASDPDWEKDSGQLWMVNREGKFFLLEPEMGTTNGIEVSPDDKHLYVNESAQRNIWRYEILDDGTLTNKRLFASFEDYGMDGMRCDQQGNLYVTRFGKGTVAILSPDGTLLKEVVLKGDKPTNVAFGGEDGCTVYVTVADRGAIEAFRTEIPGRAFNILSRNL